MSECRDDAARTPPVDRARNYATFKRTGQFGRDGREELRLGVATSGSGAEFVSLRVWSEGQNDPGLYPSKLGVSIRRSELLDAIDALTRIARDMQLLPPDGDAGRDVLAPKGPPEPPASSWQHYGAPYRDRKPDVSVDHVGLYAGQGRRRVNLSEACKSAAFDALVERHLED